MILDSRPALYRDRMAVALAGTPLPVVHWPLFTPRATGARWPKPEDFEAVLLTSQVVLGFIPAIWLNTTAYAVGEATAEAARAAGFTHVVCTGYDARDMTQVLSAASFQSAFYPSAVTVAADLATALPGRVERLAVYDMVPEAALPETLRGQIAAAERVIAPLFSRQTAVYLGPLLGGVKTPIDAIGISAAVFEGLSSPWRQRVIASQPTLEAIATEVHRLARGAEGFS